MYSFIKCVNLESLTFIISVLIELIIIDIVQVYFFIFKLGIFLELNRKAPFHFCYEFDHNNQFKERLTQLI